MKKNKRGCGGKVRKLGVYYQINKWPMGLIGHLSNCSMTFATYIHVHYNYWANEIIFNAPVLFNPKNFLNSKQEANRH